MFIGLIKKNGELIKIVNINANDKVIAEKKLKVFEETFNDTTISSQFVDTDYLETISKLHYYK